MSGDARSLESVVSNLVTNALKLWTSHLPFILTR